MNDITIRQIFKNSIKRGSGEAHLIMLDNPSVDFSAAIIKASLKNFAYDGQSEGSRAVYIFELIELSGQKEKVKKAILKGLLSERADTWTLVQLFDLAALFAKQGDKGAKQAIYKRFYKKTIPCSEWVGQDAIIGLDGLEGLKYIAKTKGKALYKNPKEWEDSWLVDDFQEKNPNIKVYDELERSSKTDKYIKTYLDEIKKCKTKSPKRKEIKYNYKTISDKIKDNVTVPLPPAKAKELSWQDIYKLADDFLKEKDRKKLEKYLRVFNHIKYPYKYSVILKLAKSKNKKSDRLVEFAVGALGYFSGTDIREFALEKIKNIKIPSDYMGLLVSNYEQNDSKLLAEILVRSGDKHDIHSLASEYINIYKTNKTKECKEPLEILYDKLTCGICRESIVKILIDNGVLSRRLRQEIKYDSNPNIRKIIQINQENSHLN